MDASGLLVGLWQDAIIFKRQAQACKAVQENSRGLYPNSLVIMYTARDAIEKISLLFEGKPKLQDRYSVFLGHLSTLSKGVMNVKSADVLETGELIHTIIQLCRESDFTLDEDSILRRRVACLDELLIQYVGQSARLKREQNEKLYSHIFQLSAVIPREYLIKMEPSKISPSKASQKVTSHLDVPKSLYQGKLFSQVAESFRCLQNIANCFDDDDNLTDALPILQVMVSNLNASLKATSKAGLPIPEAILAKGE